MSEIKMHTSKKNLKKGLGRGLGSLLGTSSETETESATKVEPLPPTLVKEPAEVMTQATDLRQKVSFKESTVKPLQEGLIETKVEGKTTIQKPQSNIPETQRIWQIPVEKLTAQKDQPRKDFDPEPLKELAASIKEQGILQPIIARKNSANEFEIIAGERRWRAAQLAGIERVPVILKITDDQTARELALIENIQRQDLNPIEEAEAFETLIKKYKLTQQELADRLGKDRVSIANTLRLLKLHPDLRLYVKTGELSQGQAKVLLGVEESHLQKKLGLEVIRKKMTVRATEQLVSKTKHQSSGESDPSALEDLGVSTRLVKALAQELQKQLKTRVVIDYTNGKGRIKINFHSDVELNQIVDKLRSE